MQKLIRLPVINKEKINIFLVGFSFLLFCVSESFLLINKTISLQLKIAGFILLVMSLFLKPRFNRKLSMLFVLVPVMLLSLYKSYNLHAGMEEFLRFLFPVVIIISLYKERKNIELIALFFIAVTISNNLYQVYVYIAYAMDLPMLLPVRFEARYIIRAEGWIGFFSNYGFMNFCSFLLVHHTDIFNKNKKTIAVSFLVFAILSTSIKVFFAIVLYALFFMKNKRVAWFISIICFFIFCFSMFQPKVVGDLVYTLDNKIAFYITQGNSARSDSYRVMFESISQPNFFGEGLGTFGGPASTRNYSPLYAKYNFNWYGLESQLSTTDTLYPHVFVELGLLGGGLYLFFIFSYGVRQRTRLWFVVMLSFALDNLVSFALLSPPYFFSAALCMILFSRRQPDGQSI